VLWDFRTEEESSEELEGGIMDTGEVDVAVIAVILWHFLVYLRRGEGKKGKRGNSQRELWLDQSKRWNQRPLEKNH
jgi:hypothetical protein